MAPLFERITPRERISEKSTPAPLREALHHIFANAGGGLWLVGGTALAGYYAEHRHSDDLDLFAIDPESLRAAILAIESLARKGAKFSNERRTPDYHHLNIEFKGHQFTTDAVLDERLHQIGRGILRPDGVVVADLETLFASKAACLVSRCSEKDLFDLDWIFTKVREVDVKAVLEKGVLIDGGLNIESLLISIKGARLDEERCHFLLPHSTVTPRQAFNKISRLRDQLMIKLLELESETPLIPEAVALRQALKDQKKLSNLRR